MQWVETTGKTIDEAVELALDQLGVARDDAEVDVLEEPKTGLFGRVRSEARVRARVKPVSPRAKEERRERKPKSAAVKSSEPRAEVKPRSETKPLDGGRASKATRAPRGAKAAAASGSTEPFASERPKRSTPSVVHTSVPEDLDEIGTKFLTGLVEAFGLDATISTGVVGDGLIEFRVNGNDLGVLLGPKGQTLLAIQDLLRSIIHYGVDRDTGRIVLDVAGYRERRRSALEQFTLKVAAEVVATGESRSLEPMTPADRKVVHDTANDLDGVKSTSEGEEPYRRVVLLPV